MLSLPATEERVHPHVAIEPDWQLLREGGGREGVGTRPQLIRHIVRHRSGPVSVMPPEWCPPSPRNRVRHGLAYAFSAIDAFEYPLSYKNIASADSLLFVKFTDQATHTVFLNLV